MRDSTSPNADKPWQPGILDAPPPVARYVLFHLVNAGVDAGAIREALGRLSPLVDGSDVVVGIGPSLVRKLGAQIPGLHEYPDFSRADVKVPVTPGTLWCWLRGSDLGDLLHVTRKVQKALEPAFAVEHVLDAFLHKLGESGHGHDLTGFEDGTENPQGEAARAAAFHDGASFVAVQQWRHDLDAFAAMSGADQDNAIGRRRSDNEELDDAPPSAHVRRTAQESFDPEAFVLRRSMPWSDPSGAGLMFVAFGRSFAAFEAQMRRMAGAEDGIVDALFRFSRPVTGAYFWCPPLRDGRLDLAPLGIAR
jgi:putative iron-dependent peroxidase